MTIKLAGTERISRVYEAATELIRLALDIEQAMITDLSCVSDFSPDEEDLAKLSSLVGKPVGRHDYIVDLAEEYLRGGPRGS